MASKEQAPPSFDAERLLLKARSSDGEVRGEAVRSLCPCHAGWETFEGHVSLVLRALSDDSRGVRAHALHVFEDAARMKLRDEAEYRLQEAEDRLRRKRASRFRPAEVAPEERRVLELRWRAKRR